MLKWPARAELALRKLFEPLQDIDVYVEDENDEAFYRSLLSTATNDRVRVARVFSKNGRKGVIDAAKLHDHAARRALFIIDGDLQWVRGEPAPPIIGLYQHSAYCIENLLVCERGFSLLLSQEAVLTEPEANRRLGFSAWLRSIEGPLVELFAAFATLHKINPSIATVSSGVGRLCTKSLASGANQLDLEKVRLAHDAALSEAKIAVGIATTTSIYSAILDRLRRIPFPMYGVSGKDFVIPLAEFLLRSLGCQIKRRSLRVRLVSAVDPGRFTALADALESAARGHA